MGISTTVHTWYGWIIEATQEVHEWADKLDYDLPKGVMFLGVDGDRLVIGTELFKTSDLRWDVLSGESSFTEQDGIDGIGYLYDKDELFDTNHYSFVLSKCWEQGNPKFHSFVNYS